MNEAFVLAADEMRLDAEAAEIDNVIPHGDVEPNGTADVAKADFRLHALMTLLLTAVLVNYE